MVELFKSDPNIQTMIGSTRFPYAKQIKIHRIHNNLTPEQMASILDITVEDYLKYESCDLTIDVTDYVKVIKNWYKPLTYCIQLWYNINKREILHWLTFFRKETTIEHQTKTTIHLHINSSDAFFICWKYACQIWNYSTNTCSSKKFRPYTWKSTIYYICPRVTSCNLFNCMYSPYGICYMEFN